MSAPADPAVRATELMEALWADKTLGSSVRAKAKELYPDISIPEDQVDPIVAPMRAELAALRAERDADRAEREAERKERDETSQRRNLESALDGARAKYGLTDDGFDKMVARMKETGNYSDAEAAAAWVAQSTPVSSPNKADWLPKKLDLFGSNRERDDESYRLLHTNPDAYLDSQLQEFANDPDKYVRETFAA
jgi:hypothetical protein